MKWCWLLGHNWIYSQLSVDYIGHLKRHCKKCLRCEQAVSICAYTNKADTWECVGYKIEK